MGLRIIERKECGGWRAYLIWDGALLAWGEFYSLPRSLRLKLEKESSVPMESKKASTAGSAKG